MTADTAIMASLADWDNFCKWNLAGEFAHILPGRKSISQLMGLLPKLIVIIPNEDFDGLDYLEMFKHDIEFSDTPVFVLMNDRSIDIIQYYEKGAIDVDYFDKSNVINFKMKQIKLFAEKRFKAAQSQKQVECLLQEIEEQKHEVQNLFRVLAHDLSNSLMVLSMTGRKLNKSFADSRPILEADVKKITRATDVMKEIIENVKNLHAIESGKQQVVTKMMSVQEAVEKLQFLFEEKLKDKKISLVWSLPIEGSPVINVDPVIFVNQVMANLISNALKFSFENSRIEINISQNNEFVKIVVRDFGMGIPSDILPHLFDSNKKTSRPGTSGEAGTGFGMPLVKAFVEKMSGQIIVESLVEESESGQRGTSMILLFPVVKI